VQFFVKNIGSIFISLVLAVLVWVAAVREQNPWREGDYNRPIPVEVIAPPAGLVNTAAVPETVRLRLAAPESSWAALLPVKFRAVLDLSRQKAGTGEAPVTVTITDPYVRVVSQQPALVAVNLETLQTVSLPVKINAPDAPPPGYWQAVPNTVTVLLSGTANRLKLLKPKDVSVTLKLNGLPPGVYSLRPTVTVPAGLKMDAFSPQNLNVTINPLPGLKSSATLTPTHEAASASSQVEKEKDNRE